MPHIVLILPTSTYRATEFVDAAERLGVEITVASEDAPPLAATAGAPHVLIDCSSPETSAATIVEHADGHPIDAIVAADDQGVEIAALAAARLGLPHNPPVGVAATRNKAMLRRALARAEVPQPAFGVVNTAEDAVAAVADLGAPAVLKPLGLSASQGVIRVDDAEEAFAAAERIRRILITEGHSPGEPILVERFVPGIEVAVEGLLYDGKLEVLAVFDKPDPLDGPYFEETILITPSRLHPEMIDEVVRVTERAIGALELREGPIHAELRVDGPRVILLEVAARSIGGLCGRSLRFGLLGSSLETLILRRALGMPVAGLRREDRASGAMMLPIPRSGILRSVRGREAALAVPGITGLEISMHPGDVIRALPEGNRYLGFLFAKGPTPEDAEASLRAAHAELEFVID
ncbi:MAG TPA: ATP-grasp domain-containing protein [Acidimicrobiia bacterium]|nr:ATP-grasp domain-containing protein [Acidimicrobiia bacterium]